MLTYPNGGILIEDKKELPRLVFDDIYLDVETSSGAPDRSSLNPWKDCRACGIALTGDDCKNAYYIPRPYLDRQWLLEIYKKSKRWINHNPKYDAHVLMNDLDFPFYHGEIVDTLTQAKVLDSDRTYKGGYSLEVLTLQLLGRDVSEYSRAMYPYLAGAGNQDYGRVPYDIIGEYACQDVFDARDLWKYLQREIPERSKMVAQTEIDLTKALLASERRGLRINPTEIKLKKLLSLDRLSEIAATLQARLGYNMNPKSNTDCEDLLISRFGLPVLKRTKKNPETGGGGNPSFNKDVLREYIGMVDSPKRLLELMLEYRHHDILTSLFWTSWLEKHIDGFLHPDYNQSVRSARLSCATPNAQQMSKDAKYAIKPRPGYTFVSMDYAQIEYRMIVHYCDDASAIAAYKENPDTDYHQYVAENIGIHRRPAKTINFAIAFNMGKAKLLLRLRVDETLAAKGWDNSQMAARAEEIYEDYFKMLPNLKPTRKRAQAAAKARGYVFNAHGRELQLPEDRSWVAFNRVMQSEAAEIGKERYVAVSPVFNEFVRDHDIHVVAMVHDEFLFEVPTDNVPVAIEYLKYVLEHPNVEYKVPIRVSVSTSSVSWGDCRDYDVQQRLTSTPS